MMIEKKWERDKRFHRFSVKLFLWLLGILIPSFILLDLPKLPTREVFADHSTADFKDEVRALVKRMSSCLIDPLSKNDINTVETTVNEIFLEADQRGRPIRFGIGILDKNGMAIAGGYIVGSFKGEDFSRYQFAKKAFKKKKVVQERLYLQDHSQLLIVCFPLIEQKKVVGAIVLGFDPTQVQKDYGLNTEQFLALDLNK